MEEYSALDISTLLKEPDDLIYERLSEILLGDGLGIAAEDPGSRRKFGAAWFKQRKADIQAKICDRAFVEKVRNSNPDGGDDALAAAAIADGLAALFGFPAAVLISVLVVRMGLDKFCSGHGERDVS